MSNRKDKWANTVVLDGRNMGVWDTLTGGDVEATSTKYRPGGMAREIALGGTSTTNDLNLGRLLSKEDWEFMRGLMTRDRVGRAPAHVSRQPMDDDGNPFGSPLVYTGVLQHVTPGDTDSNSSDAQVWEIVVSVHGSIG
jgi:hypothetical protein